jgi:hypothetical protein
MKSFTYALISSILVASLALAAKYPDFRDDFPKVAQAGFVALTRLYDSNCKHNSRKTDKRSSSKK